MPPNYGWATNFGITAEVAKAINRESGFVNASDFFVTVLKINY